MVKPQTRQPVNFFYILIRFKQVNKTKSITLQKLLYAKTYDLSKMRFSDAFLHVFTANFVK